MRVSQKALRSIATDMKNTSSDGQAVLTRCIDLIGNDGENDEETDIDPTLGQSGSVSGKQ